MRVWWSAMALAVAAASPTWAQDWFTHPFGEIRAYHGAWLAVCAESGAGACRVVGYDLEKREEAQVRLHRHTDGLDWSITVFDRGLPRDAIDRVSFSFDGEVVDIPDGAWTLGELDVTNILETVTISDPALTRVLIEKLRAGNRMDVRYGTPDGDKRAIRFSLIGTTAATDAVNAIVANQAR